MKAVHLHNTLSNDRNSFYKGKTKNQHYLIHQLIMSFTFIFLLTAFLFRENDVNTNWMKFSENEQCSELRFQLAYT